MADEKTRVDAWMPMWIGDYLADTTLPPELRDALEQALAGWRAVECHPASISVPLCPLTTPGQSLH